ncbi:MAG TPA: hypothetical protein VKM93_12425 [Terriglobia bacterium]|nr:hypothetical protein [Terriglobia bacterium]
MLHQHSRRIKALLDQECVPFAEVGRRLGVTREQVRQIAELLGYPPGRWREKTCKGQPAQPPSKVPLLAKLQQDCPYPVVLTHGALWRRRVSILGHICYVSKAFIRPFHYIRVVTRGSANLPKLTSLSGTDFVLSKLPGKGWLVIPRVRCKRTTFDLRKKERASRQGERWDLTQALNAWHLFRKVPSWKAAGNQEIEQQAVA